MPVITYTKGQRLLDITASSTGSGEALPVAMVRKQGHYYLVEAAGRRRYQVDSLMLLPDTAQYRAQATAYNARLQASSARSKAERRTRITRLEAELAELRAQEASNPG